MPSCLGLYIENNIIKYAKVTKDHDNLKIDSFGMKFYDNLSNTIDQIVAETYSYKTPISVNLSNEMYNYFYVFGLLNKNDISKAIDTEFESICYDKGINKKALEERYLLTNDLGNKEKVKVIHVSTNKTEIEKKVQQFQGKKLSSICPLPICISNIRKGGQKENFAIVNIEEKTTVTTVIDNKINKVDIIEEGSKQILENISLKENSYSKAYKICKDTTIYTKEGQELQEEINEYLEDIMPTLYSIVTKVNNLIRNNEVEIEKVYITGDMSVINNIDLYFSEYLQGIKCEILKPFFISSIVKGISIKEYVEVNSAISLALQGLGVGVSGINFKKVDFTDRLSEIMQMEVGGSKKLSEKKEKKTLNLHFDLNEKLDAIEKNMLRVAGGLLSVIIIYIIFSGVLTHQMKNKEKEVDNLITDTQSQISLATSDNEKINAKTSKYKELIDNLNKINEALTEKYQRKEAIPNLLNEIMYIIPKNVQITAIENTSGKHIKITAQAEKYEQLGYFKAQLKNEQILRDIVSDQGVKENDVVKVIIEGELP